MTPRYSLHGVPWPVGPAAAAFVCVAFVAMVGSSCSREADENPSAKPPRSSASADGRSPQLIWRPVGSWAGRGSIQTESFTSDTGYFKVTWKTAALPSGAGSFRLALHSAISGRPLALVADVQGPGGDTGYVREHPRVFYAVVEASGLDWTFTVEEGTAAGGSTPRTH